MFSAVDGFRGVNGNIYVAIYSKTSTPIGGLDLFMKNDGNIYIGGSLPNVPIIYTDFTGYIKNEVVLLGGDANNYPTLARSIEADSGGNVFIAGQATGNASGNLAGTDAFVMKLDNNFQTLWHNVIYSPITSNSDTYWSGAIDSTGNFYAGGLVDDPAGPSAAGIAVLGKYDTNGNIIFAKQFANTGQLIQIEVDGSDNYYTFGFRGYTSNVDGVTLQKFYSNGTQVWGKEFTHGNVDVVRDTSYITVDSGGNSILAINVLESVSPFTYETTLTKLYANGVEAWTKGPRRTGNTASVVAPGPLATDGSNVYFIADLPVSDAGNMIIVKTDDTGNIVWERTLTTIGNTNYPTADSMTWANGYIGIVGTTANSTYGNISIVRLPDDGSGLGTHGRFDYVVSNSVTMSNTSITLSSLSDDSSNYTFTTTTSNYTSNISNFGSNITYF